MTISFGQVARFVWRYIRRRPLWLAVVFVMIIISVMLELVLNYFIGDLVDALVNIDIGQPGAFRTAWYFIGIIFISGLAYHSLTTVKHFAYDWFLKFPAMRDSATDAFGQVQRFSTDWHANSFAGSVVTKIKRGMKSLEVFADRFYDTFIPLVMVIIGIIIFMFIRWEEMGWLMAIGTAIYSCASIFMAARFVAPHSRAAAVQDTRVGGALADAISCNSAVKMFGSERNEDRHFLRIAQDWMMAMWRRYMTANTVEWAQNMIMTVLKMSLFSLAVYLWSIGRATVGDVAFVIAMYGLLSGHLRNIGNRIRELQQAVNDMEEMVEYSLTEPHIQDVPAAKRLRVTRGEIVFDGVDFQYPNQTTAAYNNFSLKIAAGERVALVGHSGTGKSTFVKLVQRLYDLGAGTITIDGQDIGQVTQSSLRQAIALVPQEPILFHRSLAENISYGKPSATKKEIEEAARQAHAHEFIEKLPKKYATLVGERGVKLSGGERQRVAIARAILTDAPILILDEATSSLDSESESFIQDALSKLMKGRTSIVVAHRLSTIKQADRILVFEDGQVAEEGDHAALVAKKGGRYKKFFEMQAGGFIGE